jgi:hypothetical protein
VTLIAVSDVTDSSFKGTSTGFPGTEALVIKAICESEDLSPMVKAFI